MAKIVDDLQIALAIRLIYYNVFSRPPLTISVLVICYSIVENTVVKVFISYLQIDDLRKSAAIVSLREGLSSVLTIFVAHVSGAYLGRFKMASSCAVAYIVGLVLLCIKFDPTFWVFYVAIVLIAFGQAGHEPCLKEFLADQLRRKEEPDQPFICDDEEQVEHRTECWWLVSRFLGGVAALLIGGFTPTVVGDFIVSACVIGFGFLVLLSGITCYNYEETTGTPLSILCRVFKSAISKRHLPNSNEPSDYNGNDENHQLPLIPDIRCLRWLDKAALKTSSQSPYEEEEKIKCTVAEVKDVKSLATMIPLWFLFLVYCLVVATGSTFFFEQSNNLEDRLGNSFKVPVISFYLIQIISKYAAKFIYKLVLRKWWPKARPLLVSKVSVGLGMACSFLCCVTASLVERHRLHLVNERCRFYNDDNQCIDRVGMSIFWLTPQFCLLGFMEGLLEDVLFCHQVAGPMCAYGSHFNEIVMGIGKFISVFFFLNFKSWFCDNINCSRLDIYYKILAILCLGNLTIGCGCVFTLFYKDAKAVQSSSEVSIRLEADADTDADAGTLPPFQNIIT